MQAVPGSNGKLHNSIKCFKCGKKGHYANKCPEADNNNESNYTNVAMTMTMSLITTMLTIKTMIMRVRREEIVTTTTTQDQLDTWQ